MGLAVDETLPVGAQPPPTVRQLSDGNPNGTVLGRALNSLGQPDKIGFFGVNPVAQQSTGGTLAGTVGTVTEYTTAQSPSAVAANTTNEKSFTVTGILATDMAVLVSKPTAQAGLGLGTARVSAANTLQVTFLNDTAASITPTAAENYGVVTVPAAMVQTAALTPAAVGANSTVEQQFAVPSVQPGQFIAVSKPSLQAGLAVVGARVVSAGVLGITFTNVTGASITPTAETYQFAALAGLSEAPIMTVLSAALAPGSVAANTTAEQTFTVPGLAAGTYVQVNKPSATPGLSVVNARVSAANTLALTFANETGAAIVPPTETYLVAYFPAAAPTAGNANAVAASVGGGTRGALLALGLIAP